MPVNAYEIVVETASRAGTRSFRARTPDGKSVEVTRPLTPITAAHRARFERERRILAALRGLEGFVTLLDAGEEPEGPFLVLPVFPAGTLRERLVRGPLPVDETVAHAQALAAALGRAHERGIVHRDLTPEAVFFTEDGKPLVGGLSHAAHYRDDVPEARATAALALDEGFAGTPGYVAPEQMEEDEALPTGDVFSLGVIIYECLSGKPPFLAASRLDAVLNVVKGSFEPLAAARPDAPNWLVAVVERALACDPSRRFADGAALANALAVRSSEAQGTGAPIRTEAKRVFGPYVLGDELGRGGMGVVYKAYHERLRRVVAIKMLHPASEASGSVIRRFEREGQAIARLRHPNIVSVHEVGEVGGRHYLAVDFIDGATLDRRLQHKQLPFIRAIEVVRDVARAVHYAHEHGVIHRDLKPQNVMLDVQDRPFVMDFGLARLADSETKLTDVGATLGTPAYMAPEQAAAGERGDTRSDVYSLGATLYHVLTGRPPFEGPTNFAVLDALVTREPVAPARLNRRATGDLETICLKALEKDPRRRYASAGELAEDLDRYLRGDSITARPVGSLERWWRRAKRNRVVTALLLLVVGSVSVLGFMLSDTRRRNAEDRHRAEIEHLTSLEKKLARALAERSEREAASGHFREAAIYAADALNRDDLPAYRVDLAFARQGPWRKPRLSSRISAGVTGLVKFRTRRKIVSLGEGINDTAIWDLATLEGGGVFCSPLRSVSRATAIAPDERSLALIRDTGTIEIVDLESHQLLSTYETGIKSTAAAWSSRGQLALGSTFGERAISILERQGEGWKVVQAIEWPENVRALAWSPDGGALAWASYDNRIGLWDARKMEVSWLAGHGAFSNAIAWSSDGKLLATASADQTARVWDVNARRERIALCGHTGELYAIDWSPDDQRLATTGEDSTLRIWEPSAGRALATMRLQRGSKAVAWTAASEVVIARDGDGIAVWDVSLAPLSMPEAVRHAWSVVAFDARGERVVRGHIEDPDGHPRTRLRLHDLATGAELASTELERRQAALSCIAFANDGVQIALGGVFGTLSLWDTSTGSIAALGSHVQVSTVAFSPDGRWLASGGHDKKVRLWDVERRREIGVTGFEDWIEAVAWHPGGSRVATIGGKQKLLDVPGLSVTAVLGVIECMERGGAWSPDGSRLATSASDGFRLWDGRSHALLLDRARAHARRVDGIAWSGDGRLLATASLDQTAKVWDATSGAELFTLPLYGAPCALAFSERHLVVASSDGAVRVWPLDEILHGSPGRDVLAETETGTGLRVNGETLEVAPLGDQK